jgi:hypothetical protein
LAHVCVVAVRLLLLLLLQPLLLSLPSPPLSPLQLLLPAQNTQRQKAAGPREVLLHPLTVSPLLLCPPPSPPLRLLSLPSLLPEPPQVPRTLLPPPLRVPFALLCVHR